MVCRINRSASLNMRQSGFLLLHMIVYLAVLTLIVLYVIQWAVSVLTHHSAVTKKGNQILAMTAACDVWVRDMRGLSGAIHHYEQDWIWKAHNGYVCWRLVNNNLIRAEGTYVNNTWHTQSQSLMAECIKDFTIMHDRQHRLAHCTIQSQPMQNMQTLDTSERTIFLPNE